MPLGMGSLASRTGNDMQTGYPLGGVTWFGPPPVPLSPLSQQMLAQGYQPSGGSSSFSNAQGRGMLTDKGPFASKNSFGGAPKQLPQQGSSLGKYPWHFGPPPAPAGFGMQPNGFDPALGQKAHLPPMSATSVGKSARPGQGGFFGQPFKGGIF